MSIASILLEEKKAMMYVEEARRKAQEIVQKARAEAEKFLSKTTETEVIRRKLQEYEESLREEAEKILGEYRARAEKLRAISDELVERAAELVVKVILGHER